MRTMNLPDIFKRSARSLWDPDTYRWDEFGPASLREPEFTPACDVEERGDHYVMSFDLPGVKKEDVKVSLKGNLLSVRGERKEEKVERGKEQYRSERYFGSFERTFQLPVEMKAERIDARMADGVLTLHVPKMEAMKEQQVKIEEGSKGVSVKVA